MSSDNSTSGKAITNGEKVIERFGGIRPMSKKIDVPVTTIQGWKKRDTIPGGRRAVILKAAAQSGIDLSDLIAGAPAVSEQAYSENFDTQGVRTQSQSAQNTRKEEFDRPQMPRTKPQEFHEDRPHLDASAANANAIDYAISQAKASAVKTSTLAAAVFLVVLTVLFIMFLMPTKKQVEHYEETIAALESEVKTVKKDHSMLKKIIPENIKEEFEHLKTQAKDIKDQVGVIAEQTKSFAHLAQTMLDPENGDLFLRLAAVEEELGGVAGASDLSGLLLRVDTLQQSLEGQEQLAQSVTDLNGLFEKFIAEKEESVVDANAENTAELAETIDEAMEGNEELQDTLAGVPKTDLKAAAYLLALTKFRSSLHRDKTPFNEDLELLHKLAADDPELQQAISRLAPQAQDGVLTPEGLSGEFKGLAGDIVVSSLKGEEVKLKDKATARINDMITIKKDGEQITGTETQVKVAKAQELLDQGDVEGAMKILQTLDGDAADTAAPFLEQAEMTLDAQNLEKLLTGKLLSNLKSGKFSFTPRAIEDLAEDFGEGAGLDIDSMGKAGDMRSLLENMGKGAPGGEKKSMGNRFRNITTKGKNLTGNMSAQGLMDGAKSALPSKKLYRDEDSGFSILAPTQDDSKPLGADKLPVDPKKFLEGTIGGSSNKPIFLPNGNEGTKAPSSKEKTQPSQGAE